MFEISLDLYKYKKLIFQINIPPPIFYEYNKTLSSHHPLPNRNGK